MFELNSPTVVFGLCALLFVVALGYTIRGIFKMACACYAAGHDSSSEPKTTLSPYENATVIEWTPVHIRGGLSNPNFTMCRVLTVTGVEHQDGDPVAAICRVIRVNGASRDTLPNVRARIPVNKLVYKAHGLYFYFEGENHG